MDSTSDAVDWLAGVDAVLELVASELAGWLGRADLVPLEASSAVVEGCAGDSRVDGDAWAALRGNRGDVDERCGFSYTQVELRARIQLLHGLSRLQRILRLRQR